MKDEKLEEEKQKLYKEATSDKNPNLIDFYRNKNIEKDKNIKSLNKNLKKVQLINIICSLRLLKKKSLSRKRLSK